MLLFAYGLFTGLGAASVLATVWGDEFHHRVGPVMALASFAVALFCAYFVARM